MQSLDFLVIVSRIRETIDLNELDEFFCLFVVELKWCSSIAQEKMKRAAVGPLPGVTQDIAGFKVWLTNINMNIKLNLMFKS